MKNNKSLKFLMLFLLLNTYGTCLTQAQNRPVPTPFKDECINTQHNFRTLLLYCKNHRLELCLFKRPWDSSRKAFDLKFILDQKHNWNITYVGDEEIKKNSNSKLKLKTGFKFLGWGSKAKFKYNKNKKSARLKYFKGTNLHNTIQRKFKGRFKDCHLIQGF